MKVNFTRMQAGEIAHKLSIVRDEPDLLDSYELSEAQASKAADAFMAASNGGLIEFDAEIADCIVGELDNSVDIALANMDCADDEGMAELRAYISSMRAAQRKVRNATN